MKKKQAKEYIKTAGTLLLGAVIPSKKQGDVSRKEAAALAYGLSMGLGLGYSITSGDWGEPGNDPEEFAVNALLHIIDDWPEERRRYRRLLDDGSPIKGAVLWGGDGGEAVSFWGDEAAEAIDAIRGGAGNE